ncbi:MAG TPA: hypothetical protein VFH43_09325 [Candidatus Kapabacteria bacterium]|nr:hypothetical protein [Candidatus Kapabacteria bacterium]
MRINRLVRALSLPAFVSLALISDASAQSMVSPSINPAIAVSDGNYSNNTSVKVDLNDPKTIKARSMTRVVVNQLGISTAATEKLMEHIDAQSLADGGIDLTLRKVDAQSLIDEHTLNVKVNYDPRPVGGILTVRVSMTPSFRGIGVSTRPTTSRSIALAVDELSEETVKTLVDELTTEIKTEFSEMNNEATGVAN